MRWDRLWNVHRQWMSRSSDGRLFHTVGPAETKKRVLQVSSWFWLWLQTSNFEVKVKHFRVLMSCIVSAASYCTAIDLSCDGTNHTISYMLYSWLCMSWGGVQHIDGPYIQVKYWGVRTPVTPAALMSLRQWTRVELVQHIHRPI